MVSGIHRMYRKTCVRVLPCSWQEAIQKTGECKKLISAELLIAETIFSGMSFAGNFGKGFNAHHKDLNDVVFIFVTPGVPTSGGHTAYFNE